MKRGTKSWEDGVSVRGGWRIKVRGDGLAVEIGREGQRRGGKDRERTALATCGKVGNLTDLNHRPNK